MVLPLLYKDQIDESDLVGLQGMPSETDLLDIKSKSYTVKPDDVWKPEICEDICAFANAKGGLIVLGMKEDASGKVDDLCGLGAGFNTDDEIKRLKQVADTGIVPSIPGLRFKPVQLSDPTKAVAIVIQIPHGITAPHKVVRLRQGASQSGQIFKIRHSNGNADMSLDELRMAFNLAESYIERVRRFRRNRVTGIDDDGSEESFLPLASGVRFVMHIVPVAFSEIDNTVDLSLLLNPVDSSNGVIEMGNAHTRRFNFDGVFALYGNYHEADGGYQEYMQVFRSGAIEFVTVYRKHIQEVAQNMFHGAWIERDALEHISQALRISKKISVQPPLAIMLSILGVRDFKVMSGHHGHVTSVSITRDWLLLPEVILTDYSEDLHQVLKPAFDIVWNSGGWSGSGSYDEQGKWINTSYG
ncbi:MAG: ATP-binding protein [Chloroflexota bacterium]